MLSLVVFSLLFVREKGFHACEFCIHDYTIDYPIEAIIDMAPSKKLSPTLA